MDYEHLVYNDLQDRSRFNQQDQPWVIKNILPTELKLYHVPRYTEESIYLGTIRPRDNRVFPPKKFRSGDKLYVMYYSKIDGNDHMMMLPHTFQSQWKHIRIGDVLYRSSGGGRQYFTSYADLSGLMLHNNLLFPLNIYFKGNLIGQMTGYDGLTNLGGSGASLYIDNDREGFRLGDQLTFGYAMEDNKDILFTITLKDNHAYHVHIGKIGVGKPEPMADTYAYSVNLPPQTGYTYYKPIGRYNSVPTNIAAPI